MTLQDELAALCARLRKRAQRFTVEAQRTADRDAMIRANAMSAAFEEDAHELEAVLDRYRNSGDG